MILDELKPEKVWKYFEDICRIPHGSGNTAKISSYLVQFAVDRKLEYYIDRIGNVIIYKPATAGYEKEPGVILQGHMDMVAVSEPGYDIDMVSDGLKLMIDGDNVSAEGTSLGGDDGIAVAMALAVLDDESICHPSLEAVFTVDEEVGMDGAAAIDASKIHGRRLLNIDNEVEGQIITGCAGGARANIVFGFDKEKVPETSDIWKIKIEGGLGGHSGTEIDKGRANTNMLAGKLLQDLITKEKGSGYDKKESYDMIRLVNISGGQADNAIPGESELVIAADKSCDICHMVADVEGSLIEEYKNVEKNLKFTAFKLDKTENGENCADPGASGKMADLISALPNGIQAMSKDVEGLVETSLNLGVIRLDKEQGQLGLQFALRSSVDEDKKKLMEKVVKIAAEYGGTTDFAGDYPGWKFRKDSPLREKTVRIYKEMFGREPLVEAIHAGLECGFFAGKIKDLDCISIGPDIFDIHTTNERLSISSTQRTYELVKKILEKKD